MKVKIQFGKTPLKKIKSILGEWIVIKFYEISEVHTGNAKAMIGYNTKQERKTLNMTQVKILRSSFNDDLEKSINNFLKLNNVKVKDIKFDHSNGYSAMIIYTKE